MKANMTKIDDQPAPIPNHTAPIWELVVSDMRDRDQVGRQRYGTPLQAHNGRDPIVDAYQEALDQAVYLRQEIEERKLRAAVVQELRSVLDDIIDECDDIRASLVDRANAALHAANKAFQ